MPHDSISPIDGRYADKLKELKDYFSEYALFKYCLKVEVEFLISFQKTIQKPLQLAEIQELRKLVESFTVADALAVKKITSTWSEFLSDSSFFLFSHFSSDMRKIAEHNRIFFSLFSIKRSALRYGK